MVKSSRRRRYHDYRDEAVKYHVEKITKLANVAPDLYLYRQIHLCTQQYYVSRHTRNPHVLETPK